MKNGVSSCKARPACLHIEIDRQRLKHSGGRDSGFDSRKLSNCHARLIRKEDSGAVVNEVNAGARLVIAQKAQRMLDWRRDEVKAFFVDLPKDKRTDDVHVRHGAESPGERRVTEY